MVARFPNVTRIAERSADWVGAKSGLVAQPSPENFLMGAGCGREKRLGRSDFHPPLQGEGRGPKGRGVGMMKPLYRRTVATRVIRHYRALWTPRAGCN